MICRNKEEFIGGLRAELSKYNISGQQDIIQDFEEHFADGAAAGETEEQVCEKLGDPVEIAKQYIPDMEAASEQAAHSGVSLSKEPQGASQEQTPPPVQPEAPKKASYSPKAGDIVELVLLDVLVFSWALPALASLIMSFYTVTVGFAVGGIGVIVGGVVLNFVDVSSWFITCFSPLSTVLLGMFMVSASVLLVLLSIKMTVGFINIIIKIINWHGRCIAGRNLCPLVGKKYRRESAAA